MLRRVADSVFWTNRYLERAENVSRFVDVNQSLSLGGSPQWSPLIYASGDESLFHQLQGGEFTAERVLDFLLFDKRNPNSILSCLVKARENARAIREVLSVPIWEAINRFYLRVRDAARDPDEILQLPADFLERVRRSSHEVIGVMEATMSHDEAWHFARIGRMLERADKTSRILDVKYFVLLSGRSSISSALDVVQWTALLESTSALHMYRRRHGRIAPASVAEFLLLDGHFPRAVRFAIAEAEISLHAVTGRPLGTNLDPVEEKFAKLHGELSTVKIDSIIQRGLHEFIDELQCGLNVLDAAIYQRFFEIQPLAEAASDQQ
ncbi:MAG: alpha-E domain-containing protein [Planctomycetes bacterium]|nr:alpha-E domain-containing protein [Planctomycetota bacterium]